MGRIYGGTLDDDDDALKSLGNLDSSAQQPKRVVVNDSVERADEQLTQAWVRRQLGRNRGEERTIGVEWNGLLDQRLAAAPPVPLEKDY